MRPAVAIVLLAVPVLLLALMWMPKAARQSQPLPQHHALPEGPHAGRGGAAAEPAPEPEAPAPPNKPPVQAPAAVPDPAVATGMPPHPSSPEYAALLSARFDADPPDVDSALERDIARKAAVRMPSGSRVDSIECRQMLCRLRSLHPDRPTYDAFIQDAVSGPDETRRLWPFQIWVVAPGGPKGHGAGARIESVIYLQRDPNPAPR